MISSRLEQACQAPASPWMPLRIASQPCGWMHPQVLACLHDAGCELDHGQEGIDILSVLAGESPSHCHDAISAWLMRAAGALREAGMLKAWRDEKLDVLTHDGHCLGEIERSAIRPFGFRTRAVHLNAWSADGRLWIAQRSLKKNTDPGKWDTLVGGLVSAGETPKLAMLRESWEEAGLTEEHLEAVKPAGKCLVQRPLPEGFQVEEVIVFDVMLDDEVEPQNQDGEVHSIHLCDLDEVRHRLQRGEFTLEAELSIYLSLASAGLDA
ncbi:MAG: NUDIX domain-containing protein [Pigmentiphaga sp.]